MSFKLCEARQADVDCGNFSLFRKFGMGFFHYGTAYTHLSVGNTIRHFNVFLSGRSN